MNLYLYSTILMFIAALPVEAKLVDNTEMVSTYNNQLNDVGKLFDEIQQTVKASAPIYEMYKNLGYATPEVPAVGRHFSLLTERSEEIFGFPTKNTPFISCSKLALQANVFWSEQLSGLHRVNSEQINRAGEGYIKIGRECKNELSTPPPKTVEENDKLEIIDIDE